jgi:hypothetical protein
MPDERVNEIYDDARMLRVIIFRREAGTFYYQLEHFSEHHWKCAGFQIAICL